MVQATEKVAAAGVGKARTDISGVVVNKALPVMRDVTAWSTHAMGKSNQIKGAMVKAEYQLSLAERRLAKLADAMNQIGGRVEMATGQVSEAGKDADVRSSMVGTMLSEAAAAAFGHINKD